MPVNKVLLFYLFPDNPAIKIARKVSFYTSYKVGIAV